MTVTGGTNTTYGTNSGVANLNKFDQFQGPQINRGVVTSNGQVRQKDQNNDT